MRSLGVPGGAAQLGVPPEGQLDYADFLALVLRGGGGKAQAPAGKKPQAVHVRKVRQVYRQLLHKPSGKKHTTGAACALQT